MNTDPCYAAGMVNLYLTVSVFFHSKPAVLVNQC